jgi:HK97 family phage portal protein
VIFDLLRKDGGNRVLTTEDLARELAAAGGGIPGVRVNARTAARHAPVFACVRVLAESVGQLPLHLLVEKGEREKAKAKEHPLYDLLRIAPNDIQTTQEWVEMIVAHLALRGNHYSFINSGVSGDRVRELLPLNPDAVTPKLSQDGARVLYDVRFADGRRDVLPAEKVFHVPLFTLDGFRGVSPIEYARESIGLDIAVARHAARLFANGANPGGVLQTDQVLGDEEYGRIRDSWEARHQGLDNAHRVAILEAGLKWAAVGLSAEDAQMLESRKFGRTEICGIFRVPPMMIQDLERATFTNSEQQARVFVDYTLMPYLTRIEARIRLRLLSEKDRKTHFAKFNVAALLRGDMKSRAEFYTRQIQNGALSPNEIREFEDMNPREGGDIYLTPANMLIDGKPPPEAEPAKEGATP